MSTTTTQHKVIIIYVFLLQHRYLFLYEHERMSQNEQNTSAGSRSVNLFAGDVVTMTTNNKQITTGVVSKG